MPLPSMSPVLLGTCLLLMASGALAEVKNGKWITFPPTTTSTTTKPPGTTLPCQTPPPVVVPCPVCVNEYCTPNMCNQAKNVPFPGDCNKFCQCNSAGAITFICPDGLEFNAALEVCDWPATSGCTTENTWLPGCR